MKVRTLVAIGPTSPLLAVAEIPTTLKHKGEMTVGVKVSSGARGLMET